VRIYKQAWEGQKSEDIGKDSGDVLYRLCPIIVWM